MLRRIYRLPTRSSRAREQTELAAAIRDITPALKTIAEELKRARTIHTARRLARNDPDGPSPDSSRR
jgi:hypothetical protein